MRDEQRESCRRISRGGRRASRRVPVTCYTRPTSRSASPPSVSLLFSLHRHDFAVRCQPHSYRQPIVTTRHARLHSYPVFSTHVHTTEVAARLESFKSQVREELVRENVQQLMNVRGRRLSLVYNRANMVAERQRQMLRQMRPQTRILPVELRGGMAPSLHSLLLSPNMMLQKCLSQCLDRYMEACTFHLFSTATVSQFSRPAVDIVSHMYVRRLKKERLDAVQSSEPSM